jgi:hypothetical protein
MGSPFNIGDASKSALPSAPPAAACPAASAPTHSGGEFLHGPAVLVPAHTLYPSPLKICLRLDVRLDPSNDLFFGLGAGQGELQRMAVLQWVPVRVGQALKNQLAGPN